jgi:hypothetical protein
MKDDLTAPERYTERALVQQRLDAAHKLGGCVCCVHRAFSAMGRGYCVEDGRTYPTCTRIAGPSFELDESALNRITRRAA